MQSPADDTRPPAVQATPRRTRDRRGRGMRGPGVMPRKLGRPDLPTRRQRFDAIALDLFASVDRRWSSRLGLVEYAVEDTPILPDDWADSQVPLASLVRGSGATPARLVLFRRPIEHRCADHDDLAALLLTVIVEQIAELLGLPPEDVDERYSA